MNDLDELKEWLRIDGNDDDITLNSLLLSSRILIKQSTGIIPDDVEDNPDALELYKLVQKMIIADFYENRINASKFTTYNTMNPVMISLYAQLEAYGLKKDGGAV